VSDWFEEFGLGAVDEPARLFTGAFPTDADDVAVLSDLRIEAVVNLCQDSEYPEGARDQVEAALRATGIEERRLGLVDFAGFGPARLEAAVREVLRQLDSGRRVYLHCRAGQQRSTAVAAGVLALRDHISIDQALVEILGRKPGARPLEHQLEDLRAWYDERASRAATGR
jgi:atypical dual specificity phosphatase